MRFSIRAAVLLGIVLALPAMRVVNAQAYPAKSVHVIDGGGVGGLPDIMARGIAQSLSETFGQPMVIDNRPGVNGVIASEACAKAAPDGHTLCILSNSYLSMNPFLYAKLPYDPQRDFAPVINIGFIGGIIIANPVLAAGSVRELVDLARAKPDAINFASWGTGSFAHLTLSLLQSGTGTLFHHIPYKAPNLAVTGVVAGEAMLTQNNPLVVLPLIKAGKLKAIGVVGPKRFAMLPDVPTFAEQGYDLDFLRGCFGIYAPAATPRPVVLQLNAEINKLLADQKFVQKFISALGVDPAGGTPEDLAAFLTKDRDTAARVAKAANLQTQ